MIRLLLVLSLLLCPPAYAAPGPVSSVAPYVDPNAGLEAARVTVVPFVPARPDQVLYAEALTEGLVVALQQVPRLAVARKVQPPGSPLPVVPAGATVVTGRVSTDAQGLLVTAEARAALTATPASVSLSGRPEQLADLQRRLAAAVLGQIGVQPSAQETRRIAAVLPAVPQDTYLLYLAGQDALRRFSPASCAEAVAQFRDATAGAPDFALAHAGLAGAWGCLGYLKLQNGEPYRAEYEQSYAAAQRALALDPDLAVAHRALGRAAGNLGRPGREAAARRAAALAPSEGASWFELWIAGGAMAPDHAYIRKALDLDPDLFLARVERGRVLANLEQHDEAIREYRQALRVRPDLITARSALGISLLGLRRFPEAAAELRQVLQAQPNAVSARCYLAETLANQGRLDEAMAEVQKALQINPRYAPGYYTLAGILVSQGRKKDAIAAYEMYLTYAPNAPDTKEVRETIEKLGW